jgi:hypothetical protein
MPSLMLAVTKVDQIRKALAYAPEEVQRAAASELLDLMELVSLVPVAKMNQHMKLKRLEAAIRRNGGKVDIPALRENFGVHRKTIHAWIKLLSDRHTTG